MSGSIGPYAPRARDAFLLRVLMSAPWAVEVTEASPLTMVAVLHGGCWLRSDGTPPQRLLPGDIVLVSDPTPYVVADAPLTAPRITIGPGQRCTGADGRDLSSELAAGVRTWGNDPRGVDGLLVASYPDRAQLGNLLGRTLPPMVTVRAANSPLLPTLVAEAGRDEIGQEDVLDRLLDVVLISIIQAWTKDSRGTAGLSVVSDPTVSRAVELIRAEPARPWTVAGLSGEVGISRSAFAVRFRRALGLTPIAYLTQWRLALAAEELRRTDRTLESISRDVGYSSPFALSTAFTKAYGVSPSAYRLT